MKKIRLGSGKLHKTAGFRYGIAGTLCLVLAAIILYVQWGGQLLEARAAGSLTYHKDDSLWTQGLKGGINYNQLTELNITFPEGFSIDGSIQNTTAKLYTNNFTPDNNTLAVSDEKEEHEIRGSYLEDGTVSFEIAYNTKCTLPKWSWTGKTGDGQTVSGTKSAYTYSSRITRTYYHLVTENTGNSFADFEETVRNAYLSKNGGRGYSVSQYMLMTNSDGDESGYGYSSYGRSFGKYIEDYMAGKGYEQYNNGMKLPLYVDGKPVLRIDMLTVTEADFFLSDYSNSAAEFRADYDVAVYKAHSYEIKNSASTAPAPTPTLESGTTGAQAKITGVSVDDRLTDIA